MSVQRAIDAYKNERLNCAQSILRAFQQPKGISEEAVQQARKLGGGRAEGGRCGALHASLSLSKCRKMADRIRESFIARAGTEKCREIRSRNTLSCCQCVELAASLLLEHDKSI